AQLHVNGDKAIPSEIVSQMRTGKLSVKPMPKARFYELYQDYVCGCVLRVARELFALLPVKMVIVTALGQILNTQPGHLEEKAVLSVAVPRATLSRIQWESVDPSYIPRNGPSHFLPINSTMSPGSESCPDQRLSSSPNRLSVFGLPLTATPL